MENEPFIPIKPTHPTELIKDELDARAIQQKELAKRLGMKASTFSRFLKNKEIITPTMALKLENALGIPADFWLKLQIKYDRDVLAIRERDKRL